MPSGASRGKHEAVELRDGESRYDGQGVRRAIANIEVELTPAILGLDAGEQRGVDATLVSCDGTEQLDRLGGNAVLAVSVANLVATANAERRPLYEFIADDIPRAFRCRWSTCCRGERTQAVSSTSRISSSFPSGPRPLAEAMSGRIVRAQEQLSWQATRVNSASSPTREAGLPPPSNRSALELLDAWNRAVGLALGDGFSIAIDVAATQLFDGRDYRLSTEGRLLERCRLVEELASWKSDFPIVSIEDPLADDDWEGWRLASDRLGDVQLDRGRPLRDQCAPARARHSRRHRERRPC